MDRTTREERRPASVRASVLVHGLLVIALFLLPGVVLPGPLRESPPVVVGHPETPPPLVAPPSDPDSSVVTHARPDAPSAREDPPVEPPPFKAPSGPPITVVGSPRVDRLPPSRTALLRPTQEQVTGTDEKGDPDPEEADAGGHGEIAPPQPLDTPKPPYPEWARRRGIEGTVVLEFTVFADGTVGDVRILEGSGHDGLDRAAQRGVQAWTFRPARRGGVPMPVRLPRKIVFRLE